MKNLCLILACLTFISVLPANAVKLIVNDANDRIVYSRSSSHNDDVEAVQEETETTVKNSYLRNFTGNPEYYNYQMRLLGDDLREELVGTRWYYEQQQPSQEEQNLNEKSEYQLNLERLKRTSREAADYYMVDMMKDPNNLVPSGYIE